jgi:hypothetical protein
MSFDGDMAASSILDSSIVGIKPVLSSITTEQLEEENRIRAKNVWKERWRRCCICGLQPTKIATYSVQGAVRIERYCDRCAEREFSRSSSKSE